MCVDAYAHVGIPRFGSVGQLIGNMDRHGIRKSASVLGPLVPDLGALYESVSRYPDRLRGFGIVFGATAGQRAELACIQLEAGALGIRMGAGEAAGNPEILRAIGERGRWLYVFDPYSDERVAGLLLEWLERYPGARLAAPHFLKAGFIADAIGGNRAELLRHPHFYAILSRHGEMESRKPYPHDDFRPWIEHLIDHMGWERIFWGSEYPVLYWRNETIASAISWIRALVPEITDDQLQGFLGGNAQRVLFDTPPPPVQQVKTPEWVSAQFEFDREVPFFHPGGISVPSALYRRLFDRYMEDVNGSGTAFGDYLLQLLKERLDMD